MKCNNRNKLVTIGDMFDFAVFKGNVFVFSKKRKAKLKSHSIHELMKLYRSKEIEFTKVFQNPTDVFCVYPGIQSSSRRMRQSLNYGEVYKIDMLPDNLHNRRMQ